VSTKLVYPSRTSERRGEGEGGGGEGERERECALGLLLYHIPRHLRLIRNAAAWATASPTLLFSDW
jgi:hypothetical protein